MKKLASFAVAGLVVLMGAIPAQAQHSLEIGMDGGLVFTSASGIDNTFDVALPFQSLRVGIFVNDQLSIEPALGFRRIDFGDDALNNLSLLATGLYHLSADRTRPQFYLQGGGGLDYLSDGDDSDTQWLAAVGGGVKVPMMDQLSVRLGLLYVRAFESDFFFESNQVRGQVGFSFFTR